MFALAAATLFFAEPAPLDMPQAEAYIVSEDGSTRLEDRYNRTELWLSQALIGRWTDGDGRVSLLARLDVSPPATDRESCETREEYAARKSPMKRVRVNRGFPASFVDAVALLAPCQIAETPRPPRQPVRGYRRMCYWQNPTNYSDIVCTAQPEGTNVWLFAAWHLAEGDDYTLRMEEFEDGLLRRELPEFLAALPPPRQVPPLERELLRADAAHSVAAYPAWRFTAAEEFAVLDNLPARGFVETFTNDLPVMRAKYAAAVPSPVDGSNTLCVARIYASRGEYLDALAVENATNMSWSAAYWSPGRRELVAHLPEKGEAELLRTLRHEAFHQYLSYATAMIPASPWLNEGFAQYFEDEDDASWGPGIDVGGDNLDRIAAAIPALLYMDYEDFYDGSEFERLMKYRLAWAVVRFIEKGAGEVRLQPFKGLKERYLEKLLETQDMHKATSAAFKDPDMLKAFVSEWKKFWKKK